MDPRLRKYLGERKTHTRNYDDARYTQFRNSVKKRDRYKCQMPGCGQINRRSLVVHHIKLWAHYPALRYNVMNGITLCRVCHKKVTGQETRYEKVFQDIVHANSKKIK